MPKPTPFLSILTLTGCLIAIGISLVAIGLVLTPQPSAHVLGTTTSKPTQRETLIYLGTGKSISQEWTTLPQIGVSLDPQYYPKLSKVTFEASLSIIGGEISVRLLNKTTGGVFHQTTLTHNTSSPTWYASPTFSLPGGANQYAVQIKTSSGELGNIDGARLRLVHE